jgi:hypothetical protein
VTSGSGISGALTGSQLKALLMLALKRADPPASPSGDSRIAAAQAALDELTAGGGELTAHVLARIEHDELSLDELRGAKDMAKRLLPAAATQPQKDAVALLYHAAVAAALVRHAEHISSQPIDVCRKIYEGFSRDLSGPMAALFGDAAKPA